ncbi:MAG: hypothetical protein LBR57_00600 [Alistipes sp.]|jgi:hypothetical protein|nr:hypothetical protein [Alistipes sp.]
MKPFSHLAPHFAAILLVSGCCKDDTPLPAGPASVAVAVQSATTGSITARFRPNDDTGGFTVAIVPGTSGAASFGSNLAALRDGTLPGLFHIAGSSAVSHTFEGLTFDEQYTVLAVGRNADGKFGEVGIAGATTATPVDPLAKLRTLDRTTAHSIAASVVVSPATVRYRYALVTTGFDEAAGAFAAGALSGTVSVSGRRNSSISADLLIPATRYPVLVECFGADGVSTGVQTLYASTSDGPGVEVRVRSRDAFHVGYDLVPNAFCTRTYVVTIPASEWDGGVDYQRGYELARATFPSMLRGAETTGALYGARAETAGYTGSVVIATLSYDASGRAVYQHFNVAAHPFDGSLSAPSAITATRTGITSTAVRYRLTMSDTATCAYWVAVARESDYYASIASLSVSAQNEWLISHGECRYDRDSDFIRGGLDFSTSYVLLLSPMNANGRPGLTSPPAVHRFTTPGV